MPGARHSKPDQDNLDKAAEHLVAAGANLPGSAAQKARQLLAAAKAVPAGFDPGDYARGEAWDAATMAQIIPQLSQLLSSEMYQQDPDGVKLIQGLMVGAGKFIASELADMGEGIAADNAEDAITPDTAMPVDNALKAISETDTELRIGNYIILFGGRDLEGIGTRRTNRDGSRGEFFTAKTVIDSEFTQSDNVMVDWEHNNQRGTKDGIKAGEFLGRVDWSTARKDAKGWFVERVLNRRKQYVQWLADLVHAGLVGTSSEPVKGGVITGDDGEIKVWPIMRDTLTVSPMEPRMLTQNAVVALKALGFLDSDGLPQTDGEGPQGKPSVAPRRAADSQPGNTDAKGITEMPTLEEITALLDKRDADRKAAEAAEVERQTKENDRIKAAVMAAVETERKAWAKSNRLPMGGGAPHIAQFADTRKYDGMPAADRAFLVAMLNSGHTAKASNALLKAVAIGVAEDKTEIGEEGRNALKSIQIDPADMLDAAKANELDYSTQTGFGLEFVPTVWSAQVWAAIRKLTFVADKLPSQGFTGPGDTFKLPVEGADPTWYVVGQATDLNATTGRPDATIGDSKVATTNDSLTFAKMAARVPYSAEIEEDSIIPWVPQVRYQLEKSYAEQFEHAMIDGDTATGATTNINHIGGTPTSTGTKRDLFLLTNGFRKSPLVTTTSKSSDGAGTLLDTYFLDILKLMGAAGLNADPTKVSFIIDANVYWKIQQLVSVKTRDVFTQATLENGMFSGIWGYQVFASWFMHWRSTTNPRKANTAGKVDLTTQANNTTGSILAVRWDQWFLGYKRLMSMKMQDIPDSDASQIIATARVGLVQRDTNASTIKFNVGV